MKNIIALLILIFSVKGLSQPDPDLFQTWYLTYLLKDDLSTPYTISQIDPEINPTLVISPNGDFNGNGACNSFSGTYEFDGVNGIIQTLNFTNTMNNCSVPIHNSFENNYFQFLPSVYLYYIVNDGTGQELRMNNVFWGYALFKNYTLSSEDFNKNSFYVYPVPFDNSFHIQSEQNINKVEILNINGSILKTVENNFENINAEELNEGMYMLRITSDNLVSFKKIIKK